MSKETEQVNCLNCRHCALLSPEQSTEPTDMTRLTTPIWCGKRKRPWPLILSGCGIAIPQSPYLGHRLREEGGDLSRQWTPVADAFLRARYDKPGLKISDLERHLKRPANAIWKRAYRLGFTSGERQRQHSAALGHARRGKSETWSAEQNEYLRAAFHDPDRWPVGGRRSWEGQGEDERRRRLIITALARLGEPHSWLGALRQANRLTPAGQKKLEGAWERRRNAEATRRAQRKNARQSKKNAATTQEHATNDTSNRIAS